MMALTNSLITHTYLSNFFTSAKLVNRLTEDHIGVVGTVRSNMIGKCPLIDVNNTKKTERGTILYRYFSDSVNSLLVMRWNDNSAVTVASSCLGVEPTHFVSRWSKHHGRMFHVRQPNAKCEYNKNMGGVDRTDQNVGCYRIHIRSNKWWWGEFAYMHFRMPGCCIVGLQQEMLNP